MFAKLWDSNELSCVFQGYLAFDSFFKEEELNACKEAINSLVDELAHKLYNAGKIEYVLYQWYCATSGPDLAGGIGTTPCLEDHCVGGVHNRLEYLTGVVVQYVTTPNAKRLWLGLG